MVLAKTYLSSAIQEFNKLKKMGENTFAQLSEEDYHFLPNEDSNSIAIIIQHLHGNMVSRFTNFLTEDGEKPNRNRDSEFEIKSVNASKLNELWNSGWKTVLDTLQSLHEEDLLKMVYIRGEAQTVLHALNRQIAHYAYHVGQIVYLAKIQKSNQFKSLSIPKGESDSYNASMKKS